MKCEKPKKGEKKAKIFQMIHTRNLRALMTEVFKSLNKLNLNFMQETFKFKETPYSLR